MAENEITSDEQAGSAVSLKPALIASQRALLEYPIFLKHLLAGLADESVPVVLVCPPKMGVDSVVAPAVEVVRHPAVDLPLTERLNRKALLDRLEKSQINILHCLGEGKAALTRWLAKRLNIPYILSIDSLRGRQKKVSLSSSYCARIVVPAKSIADDFARSYPKYAERIERINPGIFVDDRAVCFGGADRLAGIVIAHPLDDAADFDNVFGALRHLAIDGQEFMVALLGSGKAERQIWKRLNTLGLLQMVTIVTRVASPISVLAAGDIFILPRPGFAFNPLLLDLIIEDKTAVVFDPDDELSIYDCLRWLFDRRETARQIAKQAQQYLRENHKVSKMVSATTRAYSGALEWFKR
jgi:hypothetical protein